MAVRMVLYKDLKERSLQDPDVRAAYEALEPAFQVACLRIEQGMSQEELAHKVGTRQPNIARLESGRRDPSIAFLRRVAAALGGKLTIKIEPPQDKGAGSR